MNLLGKKIVKLSNNNYVKDENRLELRMMNVSLLKPIIFRQQLIFINHFTIDTMIEKVEIIVMKDQFMKVQYNTQVEKWIDLDGANQVFLRIVYGLHRPITDINFYRIKY